MILQEAIIHSRNLSQNGSCDDRCAADHAQLAEWLEELQVLRSQTVEMHEESGYINQLRNEIHRNAIKHGWWISQRSFGDIIALCHSELSEALEEYRNDKPNFYHRCRALEGEDDDTCNPEDCGDCQSCMTSPAAECSEFIPKPEGIAIELADYIIRILDFCGYAGIDIEEAILIKHEYNKTRPYRHGGKTL